jgi:hypothetical protein
MRERYLLTNSRMLHQKMPNDPIVTTRPYLPGVEVINLG